ncbi:MAG TPA: hypothetical protein VNV65_01020 [Candidatus Solibacter sp.]|jgi:hypothetical protein|nr:hypothetical protein [Candidatus Solibacter sp.]
MQARLQTTQFPNRALAIVAFAAAVLGSGLLGYAVRAPQLVSGPTRVVTVTAGQSAGESGCVWVDHRKAC